MAETFLGEIRAFAFSFAPVGWAVCNGQLLLISENQALFSLLGTQYGGNGQTTFALPNLQGRVPVHFDTNNGSFQSPGASGGEASHTLFFSEMPAHTHQPVGSSHAPSSKTAAGNVWATDSTNNPYNSPPGNVSMSQSALSQSGGSQPHTNLQPFLCLNFCIALQGIFPSQS